MIICNCNCLGDRQIKDARAAGVTSAASFFRWAGCKTQCAKCVAMIRERLDEQPIPTELSYAVAAEWQTATHSHLTSKEDECWRPWSVSVWWRCLVANSQRL